MRAPSLPATAARHLRALVVLAAATAATGAAAAQTLPWNVPHRGAIVYERSTERFDVTPPIGRLRLQVVLPGADHGAHEWRYHACARGEVPPGFEQPGFDDSSWLLGRGEFGGDAGRDPRQRTPWRTQELCLRTEVDIGRRKPRAVILDIDHDDGVRVFVGGRLVLANDGHGRGRQYVLTGDAVEAFRTGTNTVAVRCSNVAGAQYLDLQMTVLPTLPPGVRSGEDLDRALGERRDAANAVRRDLFAAFRPPPLLLQGELDEGQQYVAMPPADLRELGWWVATDLREGVTGGGWGMEAPRVYRLGDLQLKCRAVAVDASGWQEIKVRIETTPEPAPRGDSKRYVERWIEPHVIYGFTGELTVHRRLEVDGDRGRAVEFRTRLTGDFHRGKDRRDACAGLIQVETWKLAAVHDNQDAEFRVMVGKALERGTASLRKRLEHTDRGNLRAEPPDGDRSYHSGRLAIGLLALIKGGVPKDDPVVQAGFDELRRRPLIDTYSLGNALMAMEAWYAPPNEFADLKQGVIDRPRRRQLPEADSKLVRRWTDTLLENVDTRVDSAYLLRFNYVAGGRYDHSVNQYGLLGLFAAHNCGVDLPSTVWEAAANHLLEDIREFDDRLQLELMDYRSLARLQTDPEATRTVTRLPVRPVGWNYQEARRGGEDAPVWGAMTCAGISGLAICQAGLLANTQVQRARLQSQATMVRNAAFGWLARNLTVRYHPGWIQRQHGHFYYYLYGLERAALLSGVALIADRDWYFEGAMMLVLSQGGNGEWPAELHAEQGIERDAMAILFLKQSTLPVLTGQ